MKKLNNHRGETLVEVLAAILVASLSVALLFSCVMASSNLDTQAKTVDQEYYQALSAAERQETPVSGAADVTATVAAGAPPSDPDKPGEPKTELSVGIYGGAGVYSYRRTGS